jgi:hypothetical protein
MRHKLNFTIYEDGSTDSIIFVDKSEYYEYPTNPVVEVTFPNLVDEVYHQYIIPEQVNVLTLGKLCFNDTTEFQDGVYTFRYSVAPNANLYKQFNYLRHTKLSNKFNEYLLQDLTEEEINKLYKVDLLLRAGSNVVKTDVSKASEYYNLADKLIKKLECNGNM